MPHGGALGEEMAVSSGRQTRGSEPADLGAAGLGTGSRRRISGRPVLAGALGRRAREPGRGRRGGLGCVAGAGRS
jgi:hypothetical protein